MIFIVTLQTKRRNSGFAKLIEQFVSWFCCTASFQQQKSCCRGSRKCRAPNPSSKRLFAVLTCKLPKCRCDVILLRQFELLLDSHDQCYLHLDLFPQKHFFSLLLLQKQMQSPWGLINHRLRQIVRTILSNRLMNIVQRRMVIVAMEEAAASWTEQRANIRVVAEARDLLPAR